MIAIALVKRDSFDALCEEFDYEVKPVNELTLMGEWYIRFVFQCDEDPSPQVDIIIENIVQEPRYCYICAHQLRVDNKTGYCGQHQDCNPRRSQRKRKNRD